MSTAKLAQAARLLAEGRPEQARQLLARALQSSPGDADLCNSMMLTLLRLGMHDQALHYAERAARARPHDPALLANVGNCLATLGRQPEAESALRRAAAIDPARDEPRIALANFFCVTDRYADADAELAPLAARRPLDPLIAAQRVGILPHLLRIREAIAIGRAAAERMPADPRVSAALAFAMNYDPDSTPVEVLAAHRRFGTLLSRPGPDPVFPNSPEPDRTLRLGIVSQDLRRHPVATFLEPMLTHADRSRLHITCYATGGREDDTTHRLRLLADAWVGATALSTDSLRARIASDRIDILLDTAGLTQGHRLDLFSPRAAPVQVTYLGYPNTTGLREFDARFVDTSTDPDDSLCIERPARLVPCFLCYRPPTDAPPVRPRDPGPPVFGSFNAAAKLNPRTAALWARVLHATPGSRLILKSLGFHDERTRRAAADLFTAADLDPARVHLLPPATDTRSHLGAYHAIDIALDPFPYNGTTTTCEALWMGVPVVSLIGSAHAGRVGLSLLSASGLGHLAALSEDHYVTITSELASDHSGLASIRAGLRDRVRDSPLCDGPAHAARVETALRSLWRAWCSKAVRQ